MMPPKPIAPPYTQLLTDERGADSRSNPVAADQPGPDGGKDTVSTRIISSTPFEVEGAAFHWWAVGAKPCLVTVRSPVFGSFAEFTEEEPGPFAVKLAQKLLRRHYERAEEFRRLFPRKPPPDANGEQES